MKKTFPARRLPAAGVILLGTLLASSPLHSQITTTYLLDGEQRASDGTIQWSVPGNWLDAEGEPTTGIPGAQSRANAEWKGVETILYIDQPTVTVGQLYVYTPEGETPASESFRIRSYGTEGEVRQLVVGEFSRTGNAAMTFTNRLIGDNESKLAVEIGTLYHGGGAVMEVGHSAAGAGGAYPGSLHAFEVTGSSTINGNFYFNGIQLQSGAPEANRIRLGHLTFEGNGIGLNLGGRGNEGGTVEVASLSGTITNAAIQAYRSSTHGGKTGTLDIRSTNETATTFDGILRDSQDGTVASLTVRKSGAGTQVFSGTNNRYSGGTFITEGVLAVTNANGVGLGLGAVEVSGTGVLAGSGRIALSGESVTVESGASIAPGAHLESGFAELTLHGIAAHGTETPILSMESGSAFTFRFGEGNESDTVAFTGYQAGGFSLASTSVALHGIDVTEGEYTLFTFNQIDAAELENLASLLTLGNGFAGYDAVFTGNANAITLNVQAIPEPSAVALLVPGALGALALWRRRR